MGAAFVLAKAPFSGLLTALIKGYVLDELFADSLTKLTASTAAVRIHSLSEPQREFHSYYGVL